jgi:hypothetical protein
MSRTDAAVLNRRPTITDVDNRWRQSAYVQVLTSGAHEARSVEDGSGYWASLGGALIAALVIGLAVLTITAVA